MRSRAVVRSGGGVVRGIHIGGGGAANDVDGFVAG